MYQVYRFSWSHGFYCAEITQQLGSCIEKKKKEKCVGLVLHWCCCLDDGKEKISHDKGKLPVGTNIDTRSSHRQNFVFITNFKSLFATHWTDNLGFLGSLLNTINDHTFKPRFALESWFGFQMPSQFVFRKVEFN